MEYITSADAQNRFGQLIESAQKRPIAITRHGRPAVVVLSIDDYERRQRQAWDRVMASLQRSQDRAQSAGLTEAELDALLADES
jgi:antitoxin Phd